MARRTAHAALTPCSLVVQKPLSISVLMTSSQPRSRRPSTPVTAPPEPDLSSLNACVEDTIKAYQVKDDGPPEPANFASLQQRLNAALPKLPPAYQKGVAAPLLAWINHLGPRGFERLLAQDPQRASNAGALLDVAQGVLQRAEGYRRNATRAFQEMVSDLYAGFLSEEDRAGVKEPDRGILPPLVKWGPSESGPYTWPVDTLEEIGAEAAVVHLPASHTRLGLLGWSTLGHETAGHDILGADTGLREELTMLVDTALRQAKLQRLASYWSQRMDETASDVLGLLNIGPAAGIGLIGYFRGLREAWEHSPTLSNNGSAEDSHPADILRGYLAAATVRLLDFSARNAWAKAIENETERDLSQIVLEGKPVKSTDAAVSAQIVAKAIAASPLRSLEKHRLLDIQNWSDEDESMAARIRKTLAEGSADSTPPGTYAAHAVAAAVTLAASSHGQPALLLRRLIDTLSGMHDRNPDWGPRSIRLHLAMHRHPFLFRTGSMIPHHD